MATRKNPVSAEETEAPMEEAEMDGEEIVSIRIPLTKEQQNDVFVRVNQRTWLIKRGVTVKVPKCVVEVLEHAEQAQLEAMEFQQAHEKNG